jgi:Ion channel
MPGKKWLGFLQKFKYELLLFALIQHLYVGIVLTDLSLYARIIWPLNMFILGIATIGIFIEKARLKNVSFHLFSLLVFILPLFVPQIKNPDKYVMWLSVVYFLYFGFIFYEIIRFLIRPGYLNKDIIAAAACGYLLVIEVNVFILQFLFYQDPGCLNNVHTGGPAVTYMDIVYFCTIIQTTIGFGDITPAAHYTKLLSALFGVIGQFYSVVLVGILISKFSSKQNS